MQRHDFLRLLGAAAGAAPISRAVAALSPTAERWGSFRAWTWFHGDDRTSEATWRRRFARLRGAGITGVLAEGGNTARIGSAAKAEGLEFHRWIFTLYRSTDRRAKANHPEWWTTSG